jgi:predicted RNA binding protein YcfA (HicA-like mRNA interferase family)
MGQKKYPPISPSEVEAILGKSAFTFKRQVGAHAHFERAATKEDPQRRLVTVDRGYSEFDDKLLKSMIQQSGMTREEFYGATKRTALKAGVPILRPIVEVDSE